MDYMDDESEDTVETRYENAPEKKECALCENVVAVIGLLIGGFVAYVGIDLLTKGALSRMFTRSGSAESDDDDN